MIVRSTALACLVVAGTASATTPDAVITHYANLAQAKYADSLATARVLKVQVDAFLEAPSKAALASARAAWLAARVPYQQTEVFRFGNRLVDEWEGRVNAWPLDEGLIDYVAAPGYGAEKDDNAFYTANVIANTGLSLGGSTLDTSSIDSALLRRLHEIDDVEANVATGYHAVEFLLWGQDLNGTAPGAGERPHTDYVIGKRCTGGQCERRRAYLGAVTDLLVTDLAEMAASWRPGGAARADLMSKGTDGGLATMLVGMASLSYGELAGERMKLGLMLHDPEEEHDCFSDNTHNSHFHDVLGIENIYYGRYLQVDGSVASGPSLSALIGAIDQPLAATLDARLADTHAAAFALKRAADTGVMAYDQMLGEANVAGNGMVESLITALVEQTRALEQAVNLLGLDPIDLEGSDSLDNPTAVFQ